MNSPVKYPIGVQDFEKIITEGYLYVDKTKLLYNLVQSANCNFLSRPRRFGKSLTLSTLKAYFEGKKELFEGLALSSLEKDWTVHPVFLFSFARFEKKQEMSIESLLEFYLADYERQYGIEKQEPLKNFSNRFATLVKKAAEQTGQKVVILIDEYDSSLVSTLTDGDLHEHIKQILKPFYTVIKDFDHLIRFSFITGITRFSRMTIFSGLNNLNDISLNPQFEDICGITPAELEKYFTDGIKLLGEEYNKTYEETLRILKAYYDGYHFSRRLLDIYNPFSILNCFFNLQLSNYWFATGVPSFIVNRIKERDLDIEHFMNPETSEYVLTAADSAFYSDLAILFQTGFLTIKDFIPSDDTYILGIPNREVKEGMSKIFMEKFLCPDMMQGDNKLMEMTKAIRSGEPEKFLTLLKSFLAGVPFDLSKGNKEVYFHNTFYILTNLIGLKVQAERHTSAGSIDLVISTDKFIYVIEIKMNKKPQEALDQINSKEYALPWAEDNRKLFKIGINFSSRTRNISGWRIE